MSHWVRRVLQGWLLAGGALVLCDCMSYATARDEPVGGAADPQLVLGSRAAVEPSSEATGCHITRSRRLFVGFSDGMTLEDFELAARQAERMLAFVSRELCARTAAVDPSGTLTAALRDGPLEMFELRFTRDDGSVADVALQDASRGPAANTAAFHVLVTQQAERWQASYVAAR